MTFSPPTYRSLEEMVASAADIIRPPERLTVSEAAAKYRKLDNPGAYTGPWLNEKTPYMVEIMDELTSLNYTGMAIVGPARIGKSDIFYNWLLHGAICDPADMMYVAMTREVAREISQGDLGKVFRNTKALGSKLVEGRNNNNVFDKRFKSGTRLLMRWPVITELSAKTLARVWFADYDRMDDDIDKEGSPFDLGRKRTQTFKRFGMTVAESSPGREVTNPKWTPRTAHEAPPCMGVLGIYNRGDRRRWYWRCLECKEPFEADFKHFNYPDTSDHWEAAEMVTLRCPYCRFDHDPTMKKELNSGGKWIKDGMLWMPDGSVSGSPIRTDIASFWLKGPSAAFQTWQQLVFAYLQAKEAYDATGDETALKKTITADQGNPYTPIALANGRLPDFLQERAKDWGGSRENPVVPHGARFAIATIDVQGGSRAGFVVQVTGFGEGNDAWLIDMFRILKSERLDEQGDRLPMDPAAYKEDWLLLIEQVLDKTYPLADGSGRRMGIRLAACDYGGEDGVSVQARDFWRHLRSEYGDIYSKRFQLIKGDPIKKSPTYLVKYPNANQKDKFNAARGDVPVGFINSNEMKDTLYGLLGRTEPGGGMWNFPIWTPAWFYSQMTVEIRTAKGWEAPTNHKRRNESWDLSYYALTMLRHSTIGALRPNFWQSPPLWAEEWDRNSMVFAATETAPYKITPKPALDLAQLAAQLT